LQTSLRKTAHELPQKDPRVKLGVEWITHKQRHFSFVRRFFKGSASTETYPYLKKHYPDSIIRSI